MWQSVQLRPVAVAKNPMVAMNSSTGIPLSTWMFLKTCSAIGGAAGAAWLPESATLKKHADSSVAAATKIRG